jgi:ribosomal silencing factor RsfS
MIRQLLVKSSGICRRRVVVLASDGMPVSSCSLGERLSTPPLAWRRRGFATDSTSNNNDNDNDNTNSNDSEEWIPPSRPLMGDQGHSKLYLETKEDRQAQELQTFEAELEQEEALMQIGDDEDEDEALRRLDLLLQKEEEQELAQQQQQQQQFDPNTKISGDWLQTRRAVLGQDNRQDVLEVIHHVFLTSAEIKTLLTSLGAKEVTTVLDDPDYARMGGAKGMMFATGDNPFHISTLVRSLVEQLQARQLQDLGVSGAIGDGAEGGIQDSWRVVDCSNFIVHIQDQKTRKHLKLEDLWSGKDPLWRLDLKNDEAVEEYIRTHPVPADYGNVAVDVDWDSSLVSKLENSRWTAPHRPVIPKHGRKVAGRRR